MTNAETHGRKLEVKRQNGFREEKKDACQIELNFAYNI